MVLLFPAGIPGGTELVIILLIMLFGFVPLALLVVGVYLFGKSRGERAAAEESPSDRQ